MGGDQPQSGVEDGGTTTEVVAEENKKINTKKQMTREHWVSHHHTSFLESSGYPITTPHSWNPLAGVGDDQLQPGVEDGGTPTEVVARVEE